MHVVVRTPDQFSVSSADGSFEGQLCINARHRLDDLRGAVVARLARQRDRFYIDGDLDDMEVVYEEMKEYTERLTEEEFAPYLLNELVRGNIEAQLALSSARPSPELSETLERVAEGGAFVLEATGTRLTPAWTAYAALSSSHPDDLAKLTAARHTGVRLASLVQRVSALKDAEERVQALRYEPVPSLDEVLPWSRLSDTAPQFFGPVHGDGSEIPEASLA